MRAPGGGGLLRYLNGLDAHFNQAAKLSAGTLDSGAMPLADAYLSAIRQLMAQGRYAHARALAEFARKQFTGDKDRDKLFAAEYDRAGQTAYDANWLTEGKYPSRTGVVTDAAFYPPLRMSGTSDRSAQLGRAAQQFGGVGRGKNLLRPPFPNHAQPALGHHQRRLCR